MKKNFLRMFAAILFCGLTTTVFTSCGGDDDNNNNNNNTTTYGGDNDNNNNPSNPNNPNTPTAYTLNLDFVMHEQTFDMMTVDFSYTDAKGETQTMVIDKSKAPNAQLTTLEKKFFDNDPTLGLWRGDEAEQKYPGINDYLDSKHLKVYRVTLENVAVGTTITTTAQAHILDSFQPKEENDYALMPTVLISKSNADRLMTSNTLSFYFFSAKNWDKLKEKLNSKELAVCMNSIEVQ